MWTSVSRLCLIGGLYLIGGLGMAAIAPTGTASVGASPCKDTFTVYYPTEQCTQQWGYQYRPCVGHFESGGQLTGRYRTYRECCGNCEPCEGEYITTCASESREQVAAFLKDARAHRAASAANASFTPVKQCPMMDPVGASPVSAN